MASVAADGVRASRWRPVLAGAGRVARSVAARVVPNLLTVLGLASISVGVFLASPIAGFIVAGVLLLVLDYAVEDE